MRPLIKEVSKGKYSKIIKTRAKEFVSIMEHDEPYLHSKAVKLAYDLGFGKSNYLAIAICLEKLERVKAFGFLRGRGLL